MKNTIALLAVVLLTGCFSKARWERQTFSFAVPASPTAAAASTNIIALNRITLSPDFQSRSFTYRVGDDAYEHDPYAGFLTPPERALGESIRAWMRSSGLYGSVAEPGSALAPSLNAEAHIYELCGDFRDPARLEGVMKLRFIIYQVDEGAPGRVLFDQTRTSKTPLAKKTPAALMAAWNADLREIMEGINAEYAKVRASPN